MDGVDDIAFLAASEPRIALVAALAREGELTKDVLVDRVGAARVTVNRNLERLAERGLVTETDGRYRLTVLGIVDGTIQIGVSDADGFPRALAESDDDEVQGWAETTYEDYRAAAEPFASTE